MIILNRFNGQVIFEFECETIKECVEEAVKQKVNLSEADLSNSDLGNIDLSWADLIGTDFSGSDLSMANLYNSNLTNANLTNTNLPKANLNEANLTNANLSKANLHNSNLSEAIFYCANLNEANLSYAILYNTYFIGANFLGEKLIKNPIYINVGLNYEVWITDTKIKIKCSEWEIHTTKEWENYTDDDIDSMDYNKAEKDDERFLESWKQWKEPILLLAKTHQKI